MRLSIRNGTIITGGVNPTVIRNGTVVVEGDRISEVKRADKTHGPQNSDKTVDATGKIVCPGFVNAHTHMLQCLLRGWGDDLELQQWLERVLYRIADKVTVEDVKAAATLACLEMIKTGVTFVIEHQASGTSEEMVDATATAIRDAGIRGLIARGVRQRPKADSDWKVPDSLFQYSVDEESDLTERLIRRWNGKADQKVAVCPGPVSMPSVGDELLTVCRDLSYRYNVPVHVHVAETKRIAQISRKEHGWSEVERLEKLGALNRFTQIVHGVWLTTDDIALMTKRNSNLIHCPVSNMFLASGVAPVASCHRSGVNVTLGTDGPASNNSHSMFEVLKTAALLQKVSAANPVALTSYDVFTMANWNGAKARDQAPQFGEISAGKKADLVILDLKRPFSTPAADPISAIVYCASPNNVETVIVDGRVVMESGRVLTIDEDEALRDAEEQARRLAAVSTAA